MAYFAKLDENNVVEKIHKVENSVITDANGVEQESLGQDFLQKLYKNQSIYKKCSFNTRKNKYYTPPSSNELDPDQSKAFRGWFPSIGFTYDSENDRFIPSKPHNDAILNEENLVWEPSLVDYPSVVTYGDGTSEYYILFDWDLYKYIGYDALENIFHWDPETSSWISTSN